MGEPKTNLGIAWKKVINQMLNMKKESILILFLAGVLLLIVAIPGKSKRNQSVEEEKQVEPIESDETMDAYVAKMEKRLSDILSQISGVSRVHVMLTLQDGGSAVVEKDESVLSQETKEEKEYRKEEKAVYKDAESGEIPYVIAKKTPCIEGVLVVCEGGKDASVKQKILEAIMALFPVESHKICIIEA